MAYSKRDSFENKQARLAELAKALGHPARIAILKTLMRQDVCICGEIVRVLPLAQSTVSQHLKVLKGAGLIKGEIEGPRSCYCLDKQTLAELDSLLKEFISSVDKSENSRPNISTLKEGKK